VNQSITQKAKTWLPILSIVGGFLLVYGGWKIPVTFLIYLGLLPIGFGIILFGVDAIRKKESSYTSGEDAYRSYSYRGLAAIMDGVVLVLLGIAVIGYGVVALLGLENSLLDFIKERPGLILIFGGLMLAAYSITLIFGTHEDRRGLALLGSLPGRIFGLVLLFLGLGMLLLGGLEIISPKGFDQLIDSAKKLFPAYLE
jgi:hypothetical protein